jgi:uncharacterized protein HemX
MGNMEASYEVVPPEPPKHKISIREMALIIAGIVAALAVGVSSIIHGNTVSASQANEIHALDQSNTRLAGQVADLSNQLATVDNRLAEMSAKVTAADPSSDSSLITCADIRHMDLTVTTGGSVVAGGVVDLSQSSIPLPAHCR